ncbi:MAG TPA: DUF2252 family protein [Vicinamibacterales bacterium]|nr:DUF2252 family protein [Vicinamibacterales bacterium]
MGTVPMSIHEATASYERWLARQTRVVPGDLHLKHQKMAADPFTFLRGTFYRWLQAWPVACEALLDAPRITAIGDLHVENFGTWRDEEGRLVWGVNDLDESCALPYVHDLVRLATSALLALRDRQLDTSMAEACAAILEGYGESLGLGGRPVVLAERHRWLRLVAIEELRDPVEFWEKLSALPVARSSAARAVLRHSLPRGVKTFTVARRVAGVGSLGRERYIGVGRLGGSIVAREVKALAPSAAAWIAGRSGGPVNPLPRFAGAVRVRDPFLRVRGRWLVRRLAPDCIKIDITHLPHRRDDRKLLRSMGWETANLHQQRGAGTAIARDLAARPAGWLMAAAEAMRDLALADWDEWRGGPGRLRPH